MIYRYPPEVHEFVKKWSPKLRDQELAEECNKALGTSFTAATMKSFRGNHGYRNGQKQWTKEEYWKYQTYYPKGMYEYVRDNSWGVSSKEMAERVKELFGYEMTPTAMKQFRQRHGIKSGVTGWYQKGHPPGTKGKTLEEICKNDPEKIAKVRATQFKKGHRPVNELPIGTIVVSSDGYKLRKKSMEGSIWERWEMLHRAVWEEHNGPIPDGMIVSFKDSNTLNCDISNLMLITRSEASSLTGLNYRFEDPELTQAGLSLIRLRNAANELKRGCQWNGDCEHCPADDCLATSSQASKFYAKEETECHKRYGRDLAKYRKPEVQANWYQRVGKERNREKREKNHCSRGGHFDDSSVDFGKNARCIDESVCRSYCSYAERRTDE